MLFETYECYFPFTLFNLVPLCPHPVKVSVYCDLFLCQKAKIERKEREQEKLTPVSAVTSPTGPYKKLELDISGDSLTLKRSQTQLRLKTTKEALETIHGDGRAVDGAWNFVVSARNKERMDTVFKKSKTIQDYIHKDPNFVAKKRPAKTLSYAYSLMYKGGVLTKRKYQAIRNSNLSSGMPKEYNILHIIVSSST